jgi:N6-adenosine-specific RNA methylase IME4
LCKIASFFVEIFREYLPEDAACIELFARNLLPNWTSWGNEVRQQNYRKIAKFTQSSTRRGLADKMGYFQCQL